MAWHARACYLDFVREIAYFTVDHGRVASGSPRAVGSGLTLPLFPPPCLPSTMPASIETLFNSPCTPAPLAPFHMLNVLRSTNPTSTPHSLPTPPYIGLERTAGGALSDAFSLTSADAPPG